MPTRIVIAALTAGAAVSGIAHWLGDASLAVDILLVVLSVTVLFLGLAVQKLKDRLDRIESRKP